MVRQGTNVLAPAAVPDLIGLRARRFLDGTGLGRHRGAADLMRYAALNQGMDLLSNYGGFVPIANDMKTLPPPGRTIFAGTNFRYSDAQLYALAQFIYSLTPPSNPNPFDDRAKRGETVFTASGCARCHAAAAVHREQARPR